MHSSISDMDRCFVNKSDELNLRLSFTRSSAPAWIFSWIHKLLTSMSFPRPRRGREAISLSDVESAMMRALLLTPKSLSKLRMPRAWVDPSMIARARLRQSYML